MRRNIVIGALCGVAALAGVVNADSINYAELTYGSQTVTGLLADGSATATAYSDYETASLGKFTAFSVLSLSPVAGVGGATQIGDPLIGGAEAIVFDFGTAVVVDRLDVAFLYRGILSLPDETAEIRVQYADTSTDSFTLHPTSFTAASYSGPASDVDSTDFGIFGSWELRDPFGQGRAVTQVVLQAGPYSNFGFERMYLAPAALPVTSVPLPAAVWGGLVLMGAVGAAAACKRTLVA